MYLLGFVEDSNDMDNQWTRSSKNKVNSSTSESWANYGEHLAELCTKTPRKFYRSTKAMRLRKEQFNPVTIINNKSKKPLTSS
uniref:Uncharacterized protein n=1 Tax=Arion vulgaris TaxID=1028688 RepID=A0A0B7BB86_9EUPU